MASTELLTVERRSVFVYRLSGANDANLMALQTVERQSVFLHAAYMFLRSSLGLMAPTALLTAEYRSVFLQVHWR